MKIFNLSNLQRWHFKYGLIIHFSEKAVSQNLVPKVLILNLTPTCTFFFSTFIHKNIYVPLAPLIVCSHLDNSKSRKIPYLQYFLNICPGNYWFLKTEFLSDVNFNFINRIVIWEIFQRRKGYYFQNMVAIILAIEKNLYSSCEIYFRKF